MTSFLVTGVGGPAGRSVTALLLERQQRVVGTDMQTLPFPGVLFYQVPPANAPDLLSTIYTIAVQEHVDLVIPTVSEELPVFARGWRWGNEFPVLLSSAQAVEIADDKYLTSSALSAKGVSIPRFVLPSQVHSHEEVAQKVGWPCISKPRIGRGGREVHFHTEQDWPILAQMSDRYILQEFASGTDYAPNLYVGPDGQVVVVVLEKTELKEGLVGNAKKVQRVEAPDVAELAVAAARAAGLTGPLDIDIRRRSDGIPVVLEINARFGANIRYASEVMDAALKDFNSNL
jgi:carbamoylphosphate synthase large subunit